jgi:hypothetical protein
MGIAVKPKLAVRPRLRAIPDVRFKRNLHLGAVGVAFSYQS